MTENSILNIDEATKFLRISKTCLYKYVQEGRIPAMRMGKAWKFHKGLLEDWLIQEMKKAAEDKIKQKEEVNLIGSSQ